MFNFAKNPFLFLIQWPFGVGLYVLARIILLNFLKLFACLAMTLHLQFNLVHHEPVVAPWVFDEEQVLSTTTSAGISQVLSESAKKSNIYVRVIVVKYTGENARAQAKQKMLEVDNTNPFHQQNKTVYLILNASTHESYLFAGDKIKRTPVLLEGILRIEQNIIDPNLKTGNIENAAREGSVALMTILEQWPSSSSVSILQKISTWLHQHHLMLLAQFLAGLAFLIGAGIFLHRYLKRPIEVPSAIDLTAMSLEERMLLGSIAYRDYQNDGSDTGNSNKS